jgi:hypothetical protein
MNVFEYALCAVLNEAGGPRRFSNTAVTSQHVIVMPTGTGPSRWRSIAKGSLEDVRSTLEGRQTIAGGGTIVSAATLDRAVEITRSIIESKFRKSLDLIALAHRAASALREASLDQALILAWSVTEVCQSELWARHIDKSAVVHQISMSNNRRKEILKNNDFTASIVSEILLLAGVLDNDFKVRMDQIRKARNKWAHGIEDPTEEVARESVRVAATMVNRVTGLSLPIPLD